MTRAEYLAECRLMRRALQRWNEAYNRFHGADLGEPSPFDVDMLADLDREIAILSKPSDIGNYTYGACGGQP